MRLSAYVFVCVLLLAVSSEAKICGGENLSSCRARCQGSCGFLYQDTENWCEDKDISGYCCCPANDCNCCCEEDPINITIFITTILFIICMVTLCCCCLCPCCALYKSHPRQREHRTKIAEAHDISSDSESEDDRIMPFRKAPPPASSKFVQAVELSDAPSQMPAQRAG